MYAADTNQTGILATWSDKQASRRVTLQLKIMINRRYGMGIYQLPNSAVNHTGLVGVISGGHYGQDNMLLPWRVSLDRVLTMPEQLMNSNPD